MTREEAQLEIMKEFRAYGDYNPKHLSDFLKMVEVATDQYIARHKAEARAKERGDRCVEWERSYTILEAEMEKAEADLKMMEELLGYRTDERNEARRGWEEAEANAWKNKQYAETMRALAEKAEARVKEYEGMKIHPDNACSGCRKTFAENYGQDWLCDDCKKAYHRTFLRSRQEALEEAAKVAEEYMGDANWIPSRIRSLKEKT